MIKESIYAYEHMRQCRVAMETFPVTFKISKRSTELRHSIVLNSRYHTTDATSIGHEWTCSVPSNIFRRMDSHRCLQGNFPVQIVCRVTFKLIMSCGRRRCLSTFSA